VGVLRCVGVPREQRLQSHAPTPALRPGHTPNHTPFFNLEETCSLFSHFYRKHDLRCVSIFFVCATLVLVITHKPMIIPSGLQHVMTCGNDTCNDIWYIDFTL